MRISEIITPRYTRNDVNPEKRLNLKVTNAEETVIAVLLQHPDLFDTAYELLKDDDMFTSLNRRIYEKICECLKSGRDLDISYFGDMLSNSEMGYLVSLANGEKGGKNAKTVLKDSIKVILDERIQKNPTEIKDMSDDDWAENLKRIIENKQKGNK